MILEECTDNIINITRTCIKGLGYQGTNFLMAFIIVGIMMVLAYLINRAYIKLRGKK